MFAVFFALGRFGVIVIDQPDSVIQLLHVMMVGDFTVIGLVITINQLILSWEFSLEPIEPRFRRVRRHTRSSNHARRGLGTGRTDQRYVAARARPRTHRTGVLVHVTASTPRRRFLAERHTQIPATRTPDMVNPIAELFELLGYTTEVALNDPIAGLLILISNLIFAFTFLLFFGLAAGAVLDSVMPESLGRSPPPRD